MRGLRRIILMKLTVLMATFLALYPFIMVLRAEIFGSKSWIEHLLYMLVETLAGFFGAVAIVRFRQSILHSVAVYATTLIPVFIQFAAYRDSGFARTVFEAVTAFIIYFTGVRAYFTEYRNALKNNKLYVYIIILITSFIMLVYFEAPAGLYTVVIVCSFLFILCAMVVKNQEKLDYVIAGKDIEKSGVPSNIRGYNLKITFAFFIIILVLFSFKRIVQLLIYLVLLAVQVVLGLLGRLLLMLSGGVRQAEDPRIDVSDFFGGSAQNPLLFFVLKSIACLILIYLAYKFVPLLIIVIKDMVISAAKGFSLRRRTSGEEDEFFDEFEELKPSGSIGRWFSKGFRLSFGGIRGIKDPVEKVRRMYYIIVNTMADRRIDLTKSDTTGEIFAKSTAIEGINKPFDSITKTYDSVRYGENIPDSKDLYRIEEEYGMVLRAIKK